MTLTIDLPPSLQVRLEQAARARGVDPADCALQIIDAHLPAEPNRALADLMQEWRQDDATDDPAELAERDAEWQELKAGLNANRAAAGERILFP